MLALAAQRDVLLLVDETCPLGYAKGPSEPFAGNPCAYQVHLYRRGVRLSAERRAAAKRVRRSSGRLAQSPRNQHWPR